MQILLAQHVKDVLHAAHHCHVVVHHVGQVGVLFCLLPYMVARSIDDVRLGCVEKKHSNKSYVPLV